MQKQTNPIFLNGFRIYCGKMAPTIFNNHRPSTSLESCGLNEIANLCRIEPDRSNGAHDHPTIAKYPAWRLTLQMEDLLVGILHRVAVSAPDRNRFIRRRANKSAVDKQITTLRRLGWNEKRL